MKNTNILVSQINLTKIPDSLSGELSEVFIRYCGFCGKKCDSVSENNKLREKMSGDDGFFCSFCLRNNFQNKGNKDVLPLSFRAIFAYFYYNNYLSSLPQKMWLSEIKNYIECHKSTGLCNPLFNYDDDTMLWFIDFNRIGETGKRQPLNEIYKTVLNILACFNFYENIPNLDVNAYFQKFKSSIDEFHSRRYRPENRRMLIPTFNKCGINDQRISSERLRNFIFSLEYTKIS